MFPPKLQQSLGNIDIDALKSQWRLEEEKWLAENRKRLEKQYSVTEDFAPDELLKIREYEELSAVCDKCTGLPCNKRKYQQTYQTIEVDVARKSVHERFGTCKYEKARRNRERIEHLFKSAKISVKYFGKSFSDYKVDSNNREAVKVAKKLLEGKESGAYFCGAFGTGKTFLAAILAQEFLKKGIRGRAFVNDNRRKVRKFQVGDSDNKQFVVGCLARENGQSE